MYSKICTPTMEFTRGAARINKFAITNTVG